MSKRNIVPKETWREIEDNKNLPVRREKAPKPKKKDYSLEWLRDVTIFNQGDRKVTKPYSQSAPVYTAISAIANAISQSPFMIVDWNTDKTVSVHPLNELFDRPNPSLSRSELWLQTATFLYLKGEVFWYWIESKGQAIGSRVEPAGIVVVNPDNMKHTLDKDGNLIGWVWNNTVPLDLHEVVHFKLTNPYNALRGLSPIETIRVDMDADYSAAKYNYIFFGNAARPDGIIEIPDELSEEAFIRLKREWNEKHKGDSKAHKLAILEGGGKYIQMGLSQKDMDFINQRKLSREQIFSVYKVPDVIAGISSSSLNRATAFAHKLVFHQNTIAPAQTLLEDTLVSQFFIPYYGYPPPVYGKFDRDEALSSEDRAKIATQYFNMGIPMSALNRRWELGFTDEELEEDYLPFNLMPRGFEDVAPIVQPTAEERMLPVGEKVEKVSVTPYQKQARTVFERMRRGSERKLNSKMKRFIFEQRKLVLERFNEATKTVTKQNEYEDIINALGEIWDEERRKLQTTTEPIFEEAIDNGSKYAATVAGIEFGEGVLRPGIAADILQNRLNRISGINDTIRRNLQNQIAEGIRAGESLQQIEQRIKNTYTAAGNRAKVIARTETATVMNEVAFNVYSEHGVEKKQWITAGDDKVRDSHIQAGQDGAIPVDQKFSNGLRFPNDPDAPAAEVVNCRCALAPVVE